MNEKMRNSSFALKVSLVVGIVLASGIARAGDPGRLIVELLWIDAGRVEFSGLGFLDPMENPGPVSGLADRYYDNGYVRIDDSGNSEGLTWFWGLEDDQGFAPDSINLYSLRSAADKQIGMNGDPDAPGISLRYMKPLRVKEHSELQLLAGIRFARFDFVDDAVLRSPAEALVDSYNTANIVLPTVPYHGSASGPGPLIDSEPFRREVQVSSVESSTVGSRGLSGDMAALRLGLSLQHELSERTDLSVLFGYEILRVEGTLEYNETTTLGTNGHSGSVSGKRPHHGTDGGVFLNAGLTRDLSERLTFEVSIGVSDHDPFEIVDGRHRVEWDLSSMVEVGLGLGYRF